MSTITLSARDIHSGPLILVNKDWRYHEKETLSLVPAYSQNGSVLLERRAAVLLDSLMESIHGWTSIVPVSGWRSGKEQQEIWDSSISENGAAFTQKYVAIPGHSEHQTGLAIDLGLKQSHIDFIRPDFPYRGICQTFRRKAPDFGFIERYPSGKEAVTGIGHEPWHFRYVGIPHAAILTRSGMTLEEYHSFLRQYPYGKTPYLYQEDGLRVAVSFLKAESGEEHLHSGCKAKDTQIRKPEYPYTISGNNMDGFIITEWRQSYGKSESL